MSVKPVSGIILAAGPSTRFGDAGPKQLLPFRGEPLVRRSARQALASHLEEVLVVVGYRSEEVRRVLQGLAVRIVENPSFESGQSSSVKVGLRAVDERAGAAMFMPADQPYLTSAVIDRILNAYQRDGGPIVVPVFRGQRGAPVLFDRALFGELARIRGDAGGRQLFPDHAGEIVEVPLPSRRALLDVDTPEIYEQLLART